MSVGVVLGVGLIVLVFLFFSTIIDREKHKHIRNFLLIISFPLLMIIPASLILEQTVCETVLVDSQELYIYGNYFDGYHWDAYNATSFAPEQTDKEAYLFHTNITNTYEEFCYDKPNGSRSLLRAFQVILIIFFIYVLMMYWGDILEALQNSVKKT